MTSKLITLVIVLLVLSLAKALLIILGLAALGLMLWCLAKHPRATLLALALIPITCLANARPGLFILVIAAIALALIATKPRAKPRLRTH